VRKISPELSEDELDELSDFLDSFPNAMNLEKFDGFLCALIAGPETVMPSEYLPIALGCRLDETEAFESMEDLENILGLIMKQWNSIATRLNANDVHGPYLLDDDPGSLTGIEWAKGFMVGVAMRERSWTPLLEDEEESRYIVPMLALAEADDPASTFKVRFESERERIEILTLMTAGVLRIYKFFQRRRSSKIPQATVRRAEPKVGRNEPCPCGSGEKYKNCCLRKAH
jgi:uncharacterized protein